MRKADTIVAVIYLLSLALNNALWATTMGISDSIDSYYGFEEGSLKSASMEAIYYLAYLFGFPFCNWFGSQMTIEVTLAIALLLTTIGTIIRVTSSIVMLLLGNFLIGLAQPLMLNFATMVAKQKIDRSYRFSFIGATSAFYAMGYAIGYPIPIKLIGNNDSSGNYKSEFTRINGIYFAVGATLLVALVLTIRAINRAERRHALERAAYERAVSVATTPSVVATLPTQDTMMDVLDDLKADDAGSASCPATTTTTTTIASSSSSSVMPLWGFLAVYALSNAISTMTSNSQEVFLALKGYTSDQIFNFSLINLIPAIPIPILIGWVLDRCRSFYLITGVCLIIQCVSQAVFLYGTGTWLTYISLLINGSTGACLTSVFVTLITEYATKLSVCAVSSATSATGDQLLTWNNRTVTSSILLTLIITLATPSMNSYYQEFCAAVSASMSLCCIAYCILAHLAIEL
jgi:hypothetical protein